MGKTESIVYFLFLCLDVILAWSYILGQIKQNAEVKQVRCYFCAYFFYFSCCSYSFQWFLMKAASMEYQYDPATASHMKE